MDFITEFDGSGRPIRSVQETALTWLQENWDVDVLVINAPTGSGKSAIARAIQLQTEADVVPPVNQLLDQYTDTYQGVNALKGKHKYDCNHLPLSCGDASEIAKPQSPNSKGLPAPGHCEDCPYRVCRERAAVEPTFFNPYSLFYFNITNEGGAKDNILVIDEAHNLVSILLGMAGKHFNSRRYNLPPSLADLNVEEWLSKQIEILHDRKKSESDLKRKAAIAREMESIRLTLSGYNENPENYAIDLKKNPNGTSSLSIQPISPPRKLADRLLSSRKLILMSATILPSDVKEILGHGTFRYLSLPSPIPVENRRILYAPAPVPINYKTDPAIIGAWINKQVAQYEGQNTLIHLTYGMAKKVSPFLNFDYIQNTSENKDETIAHFKRHGGVFVASGCNEGIDLPYDTCRVNIIPALFRLNPYDPVVKKKMAKTGGRTWYHNETLKALMQQAGRSTRAVDDHSVTIVGDPALPRLIRETEAPEWFREAIQWYSD